MNIRSLRIEVVPGEYGAGAHLLVDGRDLIDWVREFERPFAETLAGAYVPVPANEVLPPARHLLGHPDPLYSGTDGRAILLVCDCGEPGCWPLEARITVTEGTVTWDDFVQPHRPAWDYSRFGPFVFDRGDYEAAMHGADHRGVKPEGRSETG